MKSKLEKAKELIKDNFDIGSSGIFNGHNIPGDITMELYSEEGLEVLICYEYEYFEVFGLNEEEFQDLSTYYYELEQLKRKE